MEVNENFLTSKEGFTQYKRSLPYTWLILIVQLYMSITWDYTFLLKTGGEKIA